MKKKVVDNNSQLLFLKYDIYKLVHLDMSAFFYFITVHTSTFWTNFNPPFLSHVCLFWTYT